MFNLAVIMGSLMGGYVGYTVDNEEVEKDGLERWDDNDFNEDGF